MYVIYENFENAEICDNGTDTVGVEGFLIACEKEKKMLKNKFFEKKFNNLFVAGCIIFFIFFLLCTSCVLENEYSISSDVSLVTWNVQTFFDGNDDGIEYSEFRNKKFEWNEQKYIKRLDNLCKIIEQIDSDIFVMQEVENEKILFDISNRLSHNSWNQNKVYKYSTFSKNENSSIGVAVLSRLKILDIKTHFIDIKNENIKNPSMRPILEVLLEGKNKNIRLFVNHWKSKSGGCEVTNVWRDYQENLLANNFVKKSNNEILVACGDFNKDLSEFYRDENDKIFLQKFTLEDNRSYVYSPWDDYYNKSFGSYYYKNNWEKIDHIFVEDKKFVKEFSVVQFQELFTEDGKPFAYLIYRDTGISDHLPLYCVINAE